MALKVGWLARGGVWLHDEHAALDNSICHRSLGSDFRNFRRFSRPNEQIHSKGLIQFYFGSTQFSALIQGRAHNVMRSLKAPHNYSHRKQQLQQWKTEYSLDLINKDNGNGLISWSAVQLFSLVVTKMNWNIRDPERPGVKVRSWVCANKTKMTSRGKSTILLVNLQQDFMFGTEAFQMRAISYVFGENTDCVQPYFP